jgi:ribonuclease Z
MKIILLGTGGPKPDPNRQGPALTARVDDISFLFDAGRGVTTQLVRARIPVTDIDHIFITHHIGNLGDMILSSWNLGRKTPIFIYGPEGTQRIISNLLNKVYHRDIAFRQKEARISGAALADIYKFVNTIDVNPGLVFADKGIEVHCQFVQHGHGLGIPQTDWKCLAYRIEANHQSVTISGDAVDCQGLATLANETDLRNRSPGNLLLPVKKGDVGQRRQADGSTDSGLRSPGWKNRCPGQSKKTAIDPYP